MSEKNYLAWTGGQGLAQTRIIVKMMDRLDELERKEAERESRKGVPSQLIELQRRTKPPNIIA